MSEEENKVTIPIHLPIGGRPYVFEVEVDEQEMTARVVTALEPNDAEVKGAGDLISKVASTVKIKKKPGCGCSKRQRKLNKMIPFPVGGGFIHRLSSIFGGPK